MSTTIDDTAVKQLATELAGELLQAGDAGYDDARTIYNAMFDRRPALIARCASTADVAASVRFAVEHGLEVAVKAGGHSIAGFSVCDGGIVIDVSPMRDVTVDAEARRASAGAGVLLGEIDAATQEHGLAVPLGFVSVTGIAGLTLNGGIGYLTRKHGLSCDNLIGAEVVLADGTVVECDEDGNADLLWGLRGGGGNFGIVTRFDYRLHPVTEVYMHMQLFALEDLGDVLRHLRSIEPGLPDAVLAMGGSMVIGEDEMFPAELHGRRVAYYMSGYVGTAEEAAPALAGLGVPVSPLFDMEMPVPYLMAQMMQDAAAPEGNQNYWKAGSLDELSDGYIDVLREFAPTATSPQTQINVLTMGGAVARVAPDATAYYDRASKYVFQIHTHWEDPAENDAQIAWTRSLYDAARPHLNDGAYLNFTSEETSDRVRRAYGANYERLVALKDKYDPTNLFHMNQNIAPSGTTT